MENPHSEKERGARARVSFYLGTTSPTNSPLLNSLSIDLAGHDSEKLDQTWSSTYPAAKIDQSRKRAETDELDQPSSSSGSIGTDEPRSSFESDSGYVVVGRQRRRMSNAMKALDLHLPSKKISSGDQDSKGSAGSIALPHWSPSIGQATFGHSSISSESHMPATAVLESAISTSDTFWPMTSTEQVLPKHLFKSQLAQHLQRMDHAFPFLHVSAAGSRRRDSLIYGLDQLNSAVEDVWKKPVVDVDLASAMADHLRSTSNLDALCRLFIDNTLNLRKEYGKTIENYFSDRNRDYLLQQPWFRDFLSALLIDDARGDRSPNSREDLRLSASLLESLTRHGAESCRAIAEAGGLDFLLRTCRSEWEHGVGDDNWEILRDAASTLVNIAILGGHDTRKAISEKNIPAWMFVLLSHKDLRIRYYACLIVAVIASECELEPAVEQSQTLPLVMTFVQNHNPADMAPLDVKYRYGRSKPWLEAIVPMLRSPRLEVQVVACFQMAKEANIRRSRVSGTQVFDEVGALPALKEIAASPLNSAAANFAEQVLRIVGEESPRRLNQSVPVWTVADVEFWVTQIGFGEYASQFIKYRVDGDLLLRTADRHLINEIGMTSEYERMRFMRELNCLKRSADYGCVDPTRLDMWLMGLDKDLSVYTYEMLLNGIDRRSLIHIDENVLKNEAGISNTVHRTKVLHSIKEVKHVDELDIALLRKHVDIFICYRRSTGSQLASLLKVHLQLRGYKVFIDVDRLYAGQFDTSLLKNVRAAKHFVLVLTPHSLDRCIEDHACKDWVHLEIRTALEFGRNIVPVQDKGFIWPDLNTLPADIRPISFFNAIQWVHEYQEACVEKLDRFLKGEQGVAQEGVSSSGGHTGPTHPRHRSITLLDGKLDGVHPAPPEVNPRGTNIMKQISETISNRPTLKRSATAGRLDSA